MPHRFYFSEPILKSVVGGVSILDAPRLNIKTLDEATAFLAGYGFHIENQSDLERLWYFHRRALVFLQEKLGFLASEIPEVLCHSKKMGDIRRLLLLASSLHPEEFQLRRWSCALLRVMHVFVHSESDLFSSFSEEIQKQILSPFQSYVCHDGISGKIWLKKNDSPGSEHDPVELTKFETKPFKTSTSTVIKLLAKPNALAMSVYDRLGVRFVARSTFDVYRIVRFLVYENLISFPHIMPDQSSNTLYPVELFCELVEDLRQAKFSGSYDEVNELLKQKLLEQKNTAKPLRKFNHFSGVDHKFIKFICRKLIRLSLSDNKGEFSFFFPYEVQIMDCESYQQILTGPAEHEAYKARQQRAARRRVFPEIDE